MGVVALVQELEPALVVIEPQGVARLERFDHVHPLGDSQDALVQEGDGGNLRVELAVHIGDIALDQTEPQVVLLELLVQEGNGVYPLAHLPRQVAQAGIELGQQRVEAGRLALVLGQSILDGRNRL